MSLEGVLDQERDDSAPEELEKLVVHVDSQIVNSMNLCPERYRLEHILNFRPMNKAEALEKGSVMHVMLHVYRRGKKAGRVGPDQHGALVNEAIEAGKVAASATYHLGVEEFEEEKAVFQDYILKWQYDGWEILDIEEPFSRILYEDDTPIYDPQDRVVRPGLRIIYEGVIDLRVKDPRLGMVVVDSKTESRRSYPYILSNQFQGYEWAFGCPVIVDKIGFQKSLEATEDQPDDKGRDKSKFRRLIHDSGAEAIEEWRQDTVAQIKEAIEWHRQLASGEVTKLRKNRTSCDKYSGCIFQMVCKVPEESREYKLIAYFYKDKPWDPYTRDDVDDEEVA
jgi:hypothetical protein